MAWANSVVKSDGIRVFLIFEKNSTDGIRGKLIIELSSLTEYQNGILSVSISPTLDTSAGSKGLNNSNTLCKLRGTIHFWLV